MCHEFYTDRSNLKDEIARELLEESEETSDEVAAAEERPSFLNEERETDVELITDGGDE
jgi:hypothetical protein